jgi:hypothetical protein
MPATPIEVSDISDDVSLVFSDILKTVSPCLYYPVDDAAVLTQVVSPLQRIKPKGLDTFPTFSESLSGLFIYHAGIGSIIPLDDTIITDGYVFKERPILYPIIVARTGRR